MFLVYEVNSGGRGRGGEAGGAEGVDEEKEDGEEGEVEEGRRSRRRCFFFSFLTGCVTFKMLFISPQ